MSMSPSGSLPEDVMAEMLSWIPVKSLLRFRSVSKPWYALLTSPNFIKMHLRRANSDKLLTFSEHDCSLIGFVRSRRRNIRSLSVYCRDDDVSFNIPSTFFPFDSTDSVKIVGSCNGLVCVRGDMYNGVGRRGAIALWNPATRHFRFIELHRDSALLLFSSIFGFGFLPETDDYKLVEFKVPLKNLLTPIGNVIAPIANVITIPLLVYNLSSDSWRLTRVAVPDARFSETAIAMNGILHWMASVSKKLKIVVSFDLRDEAIRQITLPDSDGLGCDIKSKLVVLKGSLSLVIYSKHKEMDRCFEIWVMTEYGVPESWTKLFTVGPFPSVVVPVESWKNGEVIFRYLNSEQMFSYDHSIQKIEYFQVPGTANLIRPFNYIESLESVDGGNKRSSRGCLFMTGFFEAQIPSDGGMPSNDIGWKFAIQVPNNRHRLHCRLCGRVLYGWITELKQHLAHQGGGPPCPYVSTDIREQMMKHLQDSKEKEDEEILQPKITSSVTK